MKILFLSILIFTPFFFYHTIGISFFCLFVRYIKKIQILFCSKKTYELSTQKYRDIDELTRGIIQNTYYCFFLVFGLLLHLYIAFSLVLSGIPLSLSYIISLTMLIVISHFTGAKLYFPKLYNLKIDYNYLVYFIVISFLGYRLFDYNDGIKTIWLNNYGDLPFHVGMISSFLSLHSSILEYNIFPGERLSYPFLVNFWSSLIWSFSPSFEILHYIFFSQWVILWTIVFFLLKRQVFNFLPWVLLFLGGNYIVLFYQIGLIESDSLNAISSSFIERGFPLSVFLSSIWVMQRSSLPGVVISISGLLVFFEILNVIKEKSYNEKFDLRLFLLSFMAFFSSLGFLFHFHIPFMALCFINVSLFVMAITNNAEKIYLKSFLVLSVSSFLFSIPVLVFYSSKSGMFDFPSLWSFSSLSSSFFLTKISEWLGVNLSGFHYFNYSIMFILNLGVWIVIVPIVLFNSGRVFTFVFFIVSSLPLLCRTSIWEWDGIKLFIGLFVILISLEAFYSPLTNFKRLLLISFLFILSIIPSLSETLMIFKNNNTYGLLNRADMENIALLKKNIPSSSIVAAKPTHLSHVALAGKRLYVGYDGWLYSHGIDYHQRMMINNDLDLIVNCKINPSLNTNEYKFCPDYFYNEGYGLKFNDRIKELLESGELIKTETPELFKIKSID